MNYIYLIRHGQAEGQAPEAALTEKGELQALQLADFLSDTPIDHILSSPYLRARHTINPLAARLRLPVHTDKRLMERVLAGSSHPQWREMLRCTYDDLERVYEGGESSRDAMNRAVSVVKDILQGGFTHCVLVSHGNLISLLLRYYDDRFGFKEWEALTNPDVYRLTFSSRTGLPLVERIWKT
jgi:2,3-bisphosphoglycerate-dependent phosphoglycerate mutase